MSTTNKRGYDCSYSDTSSNSSYPDSPIMLPAMMVDENGFKKLVTEEHTANILRQRVPLFKKKRVEYALITKGNKETAVKGTEEDVSVAAATKRKNGTHGLSPWGMSVPAVGGAFRVGRTSVKQPLKESNQEKFNRIKTEREVKASRKTQKTVKKLKKEGKVSTLASFMYS
jgi:hypothetical protein